MHFLFFASFFLFIFYERRYADLYQELVTETLMYPTAGVVFDNEENLLTHT